MNQTMTLTHPLSNPYVVLEWFKDQPVDAVVGHGGHAGDCPLAHYLLARGYGEPAVTDFAYVVGGTLFRQEEWAKLFVYYVDTGFNNLPVTAHDAAYMVECALQELERRQRVNAYLASLESTSPLEVKEFTIETKELVPA